MEFIPLPWYVPLECVGLFCFLFVMHYLIKQKFK